MNQALFTNMNIIKAVKSFIASQPSPEHHVNAVVDGNVARSIALVDLVLGNLGHSASPKPHEVLNQCAKAALSMTDEKFTLVRNEVVTQLEAIKAHFLDIDTHPYTLAVKEMRYEKNMYGLAQFLAESGFSLSQSVHEAFNVFNKFDLKEWVNKPVNKSVDSDILILAIMLDILSGYIQKEFAKITQA
jgi:hypothetical protein